MGEWIFHELQREKTRALAAWYHLSPAHHPSYAQPKEEPVLVLTGLVETIKTELHNAGHTVDQTVHDVLTGHLDVGTVLSHAVQVVDDAARSPLVQLAEKYAGLNPAIVARAAQYADMFAADIESALQPAPPVVPAEPVDGAQVPG